MVRFASTIAALTTATSLVIAQTFSKCDPLKKADCPPNPGLTARQYSVDFSNGASKDWTMTNGQLKYQPDGAQFSIATLGESPTIESNFYLLFGYVEVKMKAAPGQGIVSAFVLQSEALDEIDWEMIGSQTDKVQSNYFGKGNTTTYDRGAYHPVTTPADTWHTYAMNWTKDATTFLIDGVPVRTFRFEDAVGGKNYPQTPMNIRLGNWVAGTPGGNQGTIDWAGGLANFAQAPFNMYVQTVKVVNENPASSYSYGDKSGNWQSIRKDTSGVSDTPMNAPAPPALAGPNVAQSGGSGHSQSVVTILTSRTESPILSIEQPSKRESQFLLGQSSTTLQQPISVITINPSSAAGIAESPSTSSSTGSMRPQGAVSPHSTTPGVFVDDTSTISQSISTTNIRPAGFSSVTVPTNSQSTLTSANPTTTVLAAAAQPAPNVSLSVASFALGSTTIPNTAQQTVNVASRITGSMGALVILLGISVLFL